MKSIPMDQRIEGLPFYTLLLSFFVFLLPSTEDNGVSPSGVEFQAIT